MPFDDSLAQELNLLLRFADSSLEGLKIHHTADEAVIAAAQRLFAKGLITQADGGYLTELGREAREAAESLLSLVTPA